VRKSSNVISVPQRQIRTPKIAHRRQGEARRRLQQRRRVRGAAKSGTAAGWLVPPFDGKPPWPGTGTDFRPALGPSEPVTFQSFAAGHGGLAPGQAMFA